MAKTVQTGIKEHDRDMTQHSLFMGGLDVTSKSLEIYDPLKVGYARLFMVKMPVFMKAVFPEKTKNFKHMLEYGFVGIDGIQNTSLEFEELAGGYTGKSYEVATVAKDETKSITIKLYEFAGSPVREYLDAWISGISDPHTGIGHYHGAMDLKSPVKYNQANHTAEAIYVTTDSTGRSDGIEYACLLTNMMPKTVKKDHYNYESGSHPTVQVDIEFTCTKYESVQINEIAKRLLDKYKILSNYLDFNSGYTEQFISSLPESTITNR